VFVFVHNLSSHLGPCVSASQCVSQCVYIVLNVLLVYDTHTCIKFV
jgi:hypothetical protein